MKKKKKSKHKQEKHKKHKTHKHKHKHKKSRSRSPSPKSPFSNLPVIPKGAIFLEDIPKYKNKRFNCLGNLDIYSADKKNEKEKDKSKRNKQQRYFGKLSLRQLRVRGTRVLKKGKID